MSRSFLPFLMGAPALAAVGAAYLYPLGWVLWEGVFSSASAAFFTDPFFWHCFSFTYTQAFLSTALSGVFGTLGALLYSEQRFVGRGLGWRLSLICFSLPPILVVLGLLGVWGVGGWASHLPGLGSWFAKGGFYGWPGILAAHVFFNFPIFLKTVGEALSGLDRAEEKAALSLGSSRWQCFWQVTFFKIWPAIAGSSVLVFLLCSSSFLTVLLLGGGPKFTTLEVAVYQAIKVDFDLALASRLAAVQIAVSLVVYFGVWGRLPRAKPVRESRERPGGPPLYLPTRAGGRAVSRVLYGGIFAILALLPLAGLARGFVFLNAENLLFLWGPVLASLALAFAVGLFSLGLAFALAYLAHCRRKLAPSLDLLCSLPIAASTLLLVLGWSYAYPQFQGTVASFLRGAWVQTILALPLSYRVMRGGFRSLSQSQERAAVSLGASAWQTLAWWIVPNLRQAGRLAFLLGAAYSLGEIGALIVFADPSLETLPLAIYRKMARYQFSEAYAASALLLGLMVGLYGVLDRPGSERA